MNKEAIAKGGKIYYDGFVYKMSFNKGKDGYRTIKSIKILGSGYPQQAVILNNLDINEILERALKYVNWHNAEQIY